MTYDIIVYCLGCGMYLINFGVCPTYKNIKVPIQDRIQKYRYQYMAFISVSSPIDNYNGNECLNRRNQRPESEKLLLYILFPRCVNCVFLVFLHKSITTWLLGALMVDEDACCLCYTGKSIILQISCKKRIRF